MFVCLKQNTLNLTEGNTEGKAFSPALPKTATQLTGTQTADSRSTMALGGGDWQYPKGMDSFAHTFKMPLGLPGSIW